jgi:flagellar basal-body rod protein FlgC
MFDPGHPSADESGFVALPAVNTMLEMMSLMTAQRAYEANVVAMNAAKSMVMKSIEIGGNS